MQVSSDQPHAGPDGLGIGDVAATLGVSTSLLRTWERRFGLEPARTTGGHRRYSIGDVEQLLALRDLLGGRAALPHRSRHGDSAFAGDVETVLATTRALVRARTVAEVRDTLTAFVRVLGGTVAEVADDVDGALPYDLSFGEGAPVVPVASEPSVVRLRLEQSLPEVLEDARRVVALLRAAG